MKSSVLTLTWLLLTSAISPAQGPVVPTRPAGEFFVVRMTNAPFPHPARQQGYLRDKQEFPAEKHYDDNRVAFFVPRGWKPGTNVDVVVHFHGHRAELTHALEKFQLLEQFSASGRRAILVAPQGPRDAPDSFGGKLEDPGGFRRFMDEVLTALRDRGLAREAGIGRVVLSGHSGGYQVISAILAHGGLTPLIKEVYLFDALYGQNDRFLHWLEGDASARLVLIHTMNGGTWKQTQALVQSLREKKVPLLLRQEQGTTTEQLRSHRAAILFSELGHNEVVFKSHAFRDFLMTGGLPALGEAKTDAKK